MKREAAALPRCGPEEQTPRDIFFKSRTKKGTSTALALTLDPRNGILLHAA